MTEINYEAWENRFKVVAVNEVYAGLGKTYNPGDSYIETYTKEDAQSYCDKLNSGAWTRYGDWKVVEVSL